jgi:agmatinase
MSSPPPEGVLAVLGGEHSISAGAVPAVKDFLARGAGGAAGRPEDLVVVHVDAHADLRDEYEGTPFSHACAARRIVEHCPIFQIGIRNVSAECHRFMRENPERVTTVFADEASADPPAFLDRLRGFVRGRPAYLTVDLDGLDPSIMPAVGTPEPGGISWARLMDVARAVTGAAAALVAFDVVELAPVPGLASPDFLAASLVYRVMSLALGRRRV